MINRETAPSIERKTVSSIEYRAYSKEKIKKVAGYEFQVKKNIGTKDKMQDYSVYSFHKRKGGFYLRRERDNT